MIYIYLYIKNIKASESTLNLWPAFYLFREFTYSLNTCFGKWLFKRALVFSRSLSIHESAVPLNTKVIWQEWDMCLVEAFAVYMPCHANCCHDCSSKSLRKSSWKEQSYFYKYFFWCMTIHIDVFSKIYISIFHRIVFYYSIKTNFSLVVENTCIMFWSIYINSRWSNIKLYNIQKYT